MENLLVLKNVIDTINQYPWEYWLFMPIKREDWNLNSKCSVLNLDDLSDEEDVPQFAIKNELDIFLNIADVQSIVENYQSRYEVYTLDDLYSALIYYYEKDTFID